MGFVPARAGPSTQKPEDPYYSAFVFGYDEAGYNVDADFAFCAGD